MSTRTRLLKEATTIEQWSANYAEFFQVQVDPNDITKWSAVIFGPSETPYEGYQFELSLTIPARYPFEAPLVIFTSPIMHVNVNRGRICLDILKGNWTPTQTIATVILSISSLLSSPGYDDPYDEMYEDQENYNLQVIEHCKTCAIKRS